MRILRLIAVFACVWLSTHSAIAQPLSLPDDVRQFLADHPTIRVRTLSAFPPFLFDQDGTKQGISIDYITLAARKLGLTIVPSEPMSFADVLRRLPQGDGIDVQPTMRATPDRHGGILFSKPYSTFPLIIVTRSDAPFIGGLDDLSERRVVAETAYWYTEEIRKFHPAIKLRTVPSSGDALRLVSQGDSDAYVGVLPVATWHMEHQGYTNLKIAAPADLTSAEFSFAVRGDWPLLARALDLALDSITAEEHRQIRQHWLNIPAQIGLDPMTVTLWGLAGVLVALLIMGGFALANRRLIREIHLRRQAEAQLRTSEETSRQLLDASTDACMLFDVDGTMRGCNQVFAGRFGIDPQTVPGTSLWDYFPPDVTAQRRLAVAQVVNSGVPQTTIDARGDRHLSNSIYPLKDAGGVVRRVAVYSRDITERVLAEQKIRDYVAEIERSNEDLEQFAYVASHDLREPLRQIASFVSLLERRYGHQLDEDAGQFIAYAREGVHRMDQLILDLLDYSRIGRDTALAPVDSRKPLKTAIDNLKASLAESGGGVHCQDPLPTVLASEPQLLRLFQNLVGNGLKYRREGIAPRIEISASTDASTGMATFTVSDNGIGIEAEYYDRIFGIFQRLHGRTQYPGTGIGLAICKKVVERHGGRMWLDSVPGQGSNFHFTLKLASH
ncbi:MAG: transporter substrate-binding domain-containing protein [Magnetospirillum sp.]|nr:transporter substrate-binding domain-containing protein [Magnetospirillum sp.]